MINKPTAGERIAAFMAQARQERQELWIECWFYEQEGQFLPRIDHDMTAKDARRSPENWRTWYVLEGKEFKVVFCSQWKVPIALAIWICDQVLKGRTVHHELILE